MRTNKYYINNVMDNINDEKTAYWLGFLFADGFVDKNRNRVRLDLNIDDEAHIDKFIKFLDTNYKKHYTKIYNTVGIQIDNGKLKNNLIKNGCIPLKSKIDTSIPEHILNNEKLFWNFVRGIFDGDGCIFKSRNNYGIFFMGTNNIMEQILNYNSKLKELNKYKEYKSENCYYLRTEKYDLVKYIFDNMYYDNTLPYLERKYNLFINYITDKQNRIPKYIQEYNIIYDKYMKLINENPNITKKDCYEKLNISKSKFYRILKLKNNL